MKKCLTALLFLTVFPSHVMRSAPSPMALFDAVRAGECRTVSGILEAGADVNARDDLGDTAVMTAAAIAPLDCLRVLLDHGAAVNATSNAGSTALMWASADTAKVEYLLNHGADPNAKARDATTPLTTAVLRGNTAALQVLLAHGADPRGGGDKGRALLQIAYGGVACTVLAFGCNHQETRQLLGKSGLGSGRDDLGPTRARVAFADGGRVAEFINRTDDLNALENFSVISVSPLAIAAFLGDLEGARALLDHGADPNSPGTSVEAPGQADARPLMLAAAASIPNPAIVRLLLDRGADVRPQDAHGRTALDWGLLLGETPSVRMLRAAGAEPMAPRTAPPPPVTVPRTARQAVERALARLQPAGPPFHDRGKCISCHNESLPAIAAAVARDHGVTVDAELAKHPTESTRAEWRVRHDTFMYGRCLLAGFVANVGYGLLGMAEEGAPPTVDTDGAVACLAAIQRPDGSWRNMVDLRPPLLDSSPVPYTALAIRALATYGPPALRRESDARIAKARAFLRDTSPNNTQDHVFKLLGLVWSNASAAELKHASNAVLALQRGTGGWGQWPTMEADAYSTGQALYALHAAGLPVTAVPTRRGAQYLLRTQLDDGTWFVQSRAFAQQPFFSSGFPHDRNQYISAAATAWAAIALGYTL